MLRRQMWIVPVGLGLLVLGTGLQVQAKAAYMDLPEAVQTAEVIAVVHTTASEKCEIVGEYWTYHQRVTAEARAVIKGKIGAELEILAEKSFVCARVHYDAPADYLVFLAQDTEHWATVNHGMGALRIDGEGMVEWPYGHGGRIRLGDALTEIRNVVGEDVAGEIEMSEPEPEVVSEVVGEEEPMPCGLAASYADEQAEAESPLPDWITHPLAIFGGAMAVLLGFGAAWRRRSKV